MGSGGDKAAAQGSAPEKKELLLENRWYDVTNFKHPGGSVIDYYAGKGIDSSQAFFQFHLRTDPKVRKFLESLPSRPADVAALEKEMLPGQAKLMKDFDEFTRELQKEGWFNPDPVHIVYRIVELIVMHLVGYWLLTKGYALVGLIILGMVQGRCGWLMHEGGHQSMTGVPKVDRTLHEIIYGVGCGMSGGWWRSQHNKHHSMPQKLGYDVDLNTLPLIAFTEKVCKKVGMKQKYWLRLQAFLFPAVITSLVAIGWQLFLHPRHMLRKKLRVEMASLLFRYAAWTYFITIPFGLKTSILYYLAYMWFGANYIFISFAMSHTHLPVVPKEDTKTDWVVYSAVLTMNVHPGPFNFVNWWMGYLNFQIEHHLFPSMPQYKFAKLSPRVKAFFEEHDFKYDQRTYTDSLVATFKNLDRVGTDVFLG